MATAQVLDLADKVAAELHHTAMFNSMRPGAHLKVIDGGRDRVTQALEQLGGDRMTQACQRVEKQPGRLQQDGSGLIAGLCAQADKPAQSQACCSLHLTGLCRS